MVCVMALLYEAAAALTLFMPEEGEIDMMETSA
jgi:hypothetical protein